ncbi:PrsW family glutamic-type intramembrane protease [Antribacter sp. KLBMP9083]|uniref:PrsW family glutamic-type intramembrane protease n=1 Tax=Antribacter soli TaxID=2910976 RepID=A0AA41U862_9MICO|nr:PrsW family glutamic-type intramembrane protease [Antribacter soli]MCF4122698.1 PrsW family glutamic-type intramembrane protease [Antribacter soli]
MLAFALVFAAAWGVLQLCVLTSFTRTTAFGAHLLALGTGLYFCGPLSVVLQLAYTRTRAAITGDSLYEVVQVASWTVDPVIEEAVKIVPLVLVAWHVRTRLQWGLSDHLVLGAGLGAGFGLLEALMRFGDEPGRAIATPDGWLFPSLAPPYVPTPAVASGQWLPSPVSQGGLLGFDGGVEPFHHLVWTALAGLGVGWFLRSRGPARLWGALPFVLACADHAATNYDISGSGTSFFGDLAAAPYVAAQGLRGLWPVLALALAAWYDLRVLRRGAAAHPELLDGLHARDLLRYAGLRPGWSTLVAWRFVRRRRAVLLEAGDGGPLPDAVLDGARDLAGRVRASATREAWARVRPVAALTRGAAPRDLLRRWWPLLVWLVLLMPALFAFGFGVRPGFPVVLVLFGVGMAWLVWQQVALVRALRPALRSDDGAHLGHVGFRLAVGTGALGAGLLAVVAWLGGTGPDDAVVSNFHVLDALSDLLLYGGIALILAGLIFFPPAGLVVLSTGGVILVPTLTTALGVTTTLGLAGILLAQAVGPGGGGSSGGSGSGSGSGGGPPPPSAPRPKPQVRNWKLRNIVDQLWKGSNNPRRAGDGTTMDAARWEIRSGQATHGQDHVQKSRDILNGLNNWLRANEKTATRADVAWARQLQTELREILRQVP